MSRERGRLGRAASDPMIHRYRELLEAAPPPRAAVFTGAGASHSWTWFADLLDRLGLFDAAFLTEEDVIGEGLDGFDVLLVGGGDTYRVAESLGAAGARRVKEFVRGGGYYFGSCAGAYLVLSGVDLPPFDNFNLVDGDMVNVMSDPPPPRCLAHKYLAPYGDRWVFHPVYGEVELSGAGAGGRVRTALFGGPVLAAGSGSRVIAEFRSLTSHAAFLWPRAQAEHLVLGKPAVLEDSLGEGRVMASGPHLEHPLFPRANALVARFISGRTRRPAETRAGRSTDSEPCPRRLQADVLVDIKRALSNARIVAFGLEKMPVSWKIGVKVWEPEKIRMFLDCAWRRLPGLEAVAGAAGPAGPSSADFGEELARLASGYSAAAAGVKDLKEKVDAGEDSTRDAAALLDELKRLTSGFLSLYFRVRLAERLTPGANSLGR